MAACRTVTHLKEIGENDDVYVHSSTQLTVPRPPGANGAFRVSSRYPPRPEVHVTTDHIVMQDFECVHSLSRPSFLPARGSLMLLRPSSRHLRPCLAAPARRPRRT